jgi:predicted MFS family arabinose efflux permease
LLALWVAQAGGAFVGAIFGGLLFTHHLGPRAAVLCVVTMAAVALLALLVAHWEEAGRW